MADAASAVAGAAGRGLRAGFRAGAGTGDASDVRRELDRGGLATESFLQRNLEIEAQVCAAFAARGAAAPAARHAEKIVEDVVEGCAEIRAEAAEPTAAVLERGVAEAVIGRAALAVLEHVVGLVDFLEFVLAFLVARISVRMPLHGELAKRRLDLAVARGARDLQHLVVIAFRHAEPVSALANRNPRTGPGGCTDFEKARHCLSANQADFFLSSTSVNSASTTSSFFSPEAAPPVSPPDWPPGCWAWYIASPSFIETCASDCAFAWMAEMSSPFSASFRSESAFSIALLSEADTFSP